MQICAILNSYFSSKIYQPTPKKQPETIDLTDAEKREAEAAMESFMEDFDDDEDFDEEMLKVGKEIHLDTRFTMQMIPVLG